MFVIGDEIATVQQPCREMQQIRMCKSPHCLHSL